MRRAAGRSGGSGRRWLRRAAIFLALWAGWTVFVLAASPPHLVGNDGYYHVRLSHIYAEEGPWAFSRGTFPYTTASVFHRHWADIEYLFHLAVAPFTLGWHAPPPRTGLIVALDEPGIRLGAASTAVAGEVLAVRPAAGLGEVAHLVVDRVRGRRAYGRLVRDDRSAPLAAGFVVDAPGAKGVLVDLGRGRVRFPEAAKPGLATLLEGSAVAGTVRLGPGGGDTRPFTVVHLRGGGLVPTLGAASVEDDRGFVYTAYDDAAELAAWLEGHHEDPGALPPSLRVPDRLLGPDTLVLRGRLALAFLEVVVFVALAFVLEAHQVPFALLWVALLALPVEVFSWRFAMVRAQLPSMALLLLGLHFAWRRRMVPLIVLGAIYGLTYAAPEALGVLVCIAVAVDLGWQALAEGKRPDLRGAGRPVLGTLLGLALGIAIHPNAANEVRLLAIVNVDIGSASFLAPVGHLIRHLVHAPLLARVPGLSTGAEFKAPTTATLLGLFPLWGTGLWVAGLFLWGRVRPRRFTLQALALTGAWAVLFLRSERFAEYLGPFAALTLALAIDDLRRAGIRRRLGALPDRRLRILVAVAGACAAVILVRVGYGLGTFLSHVGPPPYRATALWMRSHLPEGAQVYESEWDATATLLHFDLRQRFLVDLDPRYMIDATPDGLAPGTLARIYQDVGAGARTLEDPRPGEAHRMLSLPEVLHGLFGADYVLVDRHRDPPLLASVLADPAHFVRIREDRTAALFRIEPTRRSPARRARSPGRSR